MLSLPWPQEQYELKMTERKMLNICIKIRPNWARKVRNMNFSSMSMSGRGCVAYLIFVMNTVNAVRVKFLAECKQIPEEPKNTVFGNFVVNLRTFRV